MIRDVEVLDIRAMYQRGISIADIARQTGFCGKTVRKWAKTDVAPLYKCHPKRPSKLDPYKDYIMTRMTEAG